QAEDGIRVKLVTGVQTCALPISPGDEVKGDRQRRANDQNFNLIARGKVIFDQNGNLAANDPPDPTPEMREVNARMKVHLVQLQRSEERRVGKESRARW